MSIVSVIIPTYNRAQLLKRAIESVLAQTRSADETIVVENGSSDGAKDVVEEFRRKGQPVRYWYEERASVSVARNAGIRLAKGDFVAFLDDDDEWMPEKLERQLQCFEQNPEIGLVTCSAWLVKKDGIGDSVERAPIFEGSISFKALVTEGNCIWSPSSVLVKKTCFEKAGLFCPLFDYAEDYEWYLRFSKDYRIERVEEPLIRYRIHPGNLSANQDKILRVTILLLKDLRPSPKLGVTQREINKTISKYSQRLHFVAAEAMDRGNFRQARISYLGAVCGDPLVGLKIPWGRFSNPAYKAVRPYLAISYLFWRSFSRRAHEKANSQNACS